MCSCPWMMSREGSQHQQLILVVKDAETHGKVRLYPPQATFQPSAYCTYIFWVYGVQCSLAHGEREKQEMMNQPGHGEWPHCTIREADDEGRMPHSVGSDFLSSHPPFVLPPIHPSLLPSSYPSTSEALAMCFTLAGH